MYEKVVSDKYIIDLYKEISNLEESFGIYCKHNLNHAKNVARVVEHILKNLNYNDNTIEDAKIASILHDIGCIGGKENHEIRSYDMAKEYLEKNNIHLNNNGMVLDAIKNHRNGFDSDNIITLAVIFADKIDFSQNRLNKIGYDIEGARQIKNIKSVDVSIDKKNLIVQFTTEKLFDRQDFEKFYFIPKVFKATSRFADKFNLKPLVMLNQEEWLCPTSSLVK